MPFSHFCPNFDVQLIFVIQEMAYIYLLEVDLICMVTGQPVNLHQTHNV